MAVEDGAALAEALDHINTISELGSTLKLFEEIRTKRTGQMQEASLINGVILHFPDGPEQEARDAAMQAEVHGHSLRESPNQWSDPTTADWAYGYDAVQAMNEAFFDATQVGHTASKNGDANGLPKPLNSTF